jgi:hypothetical protein
VISENGVDDNYSEVMTALGEPDHESNGEPDQESNGYIKNVIDYGATTWSDYTIDSLNNGNFCLV